MFCFFYIAVIREPGNVVSLFVVTLITSCRRRRLKPCLEEDCGRVLCGEAFQSRKQSNFEMDRKCNTQVEGEREWTHDWRLHHCWQLFGLFLQKYRPTKGPWQVRRQQWLSWLLGRLGAVEFLVQN